MRNATYDTTSRNPRARYIEGTRNQRRLHSTRIGRALSNVKQIEQCPNRRPAPGIGFPEAEDAGWALPQIAKDWPGFNASALAKEPVVNFETLFRLAAGDPVAAQVQERCLNVWAATAVGIIHAFDPDVVIFGGGVLKSADLIIPFLQSHVNQHS
jgi:ROK family